MNFFYQGIKSMLPITTGIIPFGAVMGTVYSEANLSLAQAATMNLLVFAGSSQLAVVNLMTKNAEGLIVVITGLTINLRFMLYSAAMSPLLQNSSLFTKFVASYCLTDQNYAVMSAKQKILIDRSETLQFYFGSSLCMILAWQSSVLAGFIFGNFAPSSWSLSYAVPLSFVALVIPTLKNKTYVLVALCSGLLSLFLYSLPFNLGLIVTASISMLLATIVLAKSKRNI
jgi:predicted branched-subunit amino acid permease